MTHKTITSHVLSGSLRKPKDIKGKGLDFEKYSRMKHGSKAALHYFAKELTHELLQEQPFLATTVKDIVFPVAYVEVPPSCYYLAKYMVDELNVKREKRGLSLARVVRIAKGSVAATDYATATKEEREQELASISFTLEEDIADTHVVLVDDVRVTGMAEAAALKALEAASFASLTLAYVATVHEDLQSSPHIEARLNHSYIKNVRDVAELVEGEDWVLTIRFLKYFMKADREDQRAFIKRAPNSVVREMLDAARATGPDFVQTFKEGVQELRKALRRRERQALGYIHKNKDRSGLEIWGDVNFADYSKFKYGDGKYSAQYGRALARLALPLIPKKVSTIFVTSSGFSFVPPAAHSLVYPFVEELKRLGVEEVYPFKVERTSISNGDYAKMTKEQRNKELSAKNLFVDYSVDLTDAFVISLDDVRITGTHEKALDNTLKEAGASTVKHLYVLDAWDERKNPHTEAALNLFSIKEVEDFIATVNVPHFTPNARFCKHVINLPAPEMAVVLRALRSWVTLWIDGAIEADSLANYPAYAKGVEVYQKVRKDIWEHPLAVEDLERYMSGARTTPTP